MGGAWKAFGAGIPCMWFDPTALRQFIMDTVTIRSDYSVEQMSDAALEVKQCFAANRTVKVFCRFGRQDMPYADTLGPETLNRFLSLLDSYIIKEDITKTGRRYRVIVQASPMQI